MWFFVACFGVRVSLISHLMFAHYTFSSVLIGRLLGNSCALGPSFLPNVYIVHAYRGSDIGVQLFARSSVCQQFASS